VPRLVQTQLTDVAVRKAKPGDKRYDVYDAAVRGFGLRVATSGTKTWFVMRRVNDRMVRAKVGRYPDLTLAEARERAVGMLAMMADGDHPTASKAPAFDDVLDEWLERDQGKNRSVNDVRLALSKHVRPILGSRKLDDLRKHDILRILDKIVDGGAPVQANRVLAYLRRCFNWCIERDLVAVNPTVGIKAPGKEQSRERVLAPEELQAVIGACGQVGSPFGPLVMLLILTGQRLVEVAGMTWSELDLHKAEWSLPGARTKNGRAHLVHLSTPAMEIIKAIPHFEDRQWLFSTTGKGPVKGFSKAKQRFDRESSVTGWTFHDLRRTFATHATETLRVSPVVVDRILNHVSGAVKGVAAVYQRGEYFDDRRQLMEDWGRYVMRLQDQSRGASEVSL